MDTAASIQHRPSGGTIRLKYMPARFRLFRAQGAAKDDNPIAGWPRKSLLQGSQKEGSERREQAGGERDYRALLAPRHRVPRPFHERPEWRKPRRASDEDRRRAQRLEQNGQSVKAAGLPQIGQGQPGASSGFSSKRFSGFAIGMVWPMLWVSYTLFNQETCAGKPSPESSDMVSYSGRPATAE
jgi:hypothetical protein